MGRVALMRHHVMHVGCHGRTMGVWPALFVVCLLLAVPQATLCLGLVLQPPKSMRQGTTMMCNSRQAVRDMRRFHARLSVWSSQPGTLRRHHVLCSRELSSPPLGAAFDSSSRGGNGPEADLESGGKLTLESETERLMSVPTIDIKLELQMRGVEHRDAFEKAELAKRLAEARLSSSPPLLTVADSGDRGGVSPKQSYRKTQREEERHRDTDGNWPESRSRKSWGSTVSDSTSRSAGGEGREEGEEDEGEGEEEDEQHARYVARALQMGKPAVMRELNALGIAHSRLSNLSVLAHQFASAKVEGHSEAEEAGWFSMDEDVEHRVETARLMALGREELTSQLRALKVDIPWQASEGEMAKLLAKAKSGNVARVTRDDDEESGDVETIGEKKKQGWGWERWTTGRRGHASSMMSWNEEQVEVAEEDEVADDEQGWAGSVWTGNSGMWDNSNRDSDAETDRSVRGNAGSDADDTGDSEELFFSQERFARDSVSAMKAPLQARAGRMSSRQLMSALDSLGEPYPIPSPRADLEDKFVSAVLKGQQYTGVAGGGGSGTDIVQTNPFAAGGEGDGVEFRSVAFETYHAALQWARQLNFDDVMDELRYRGLEFKPDGDFSYLTRLLADDVLADEEMIESDRSRGGHGTKLAAALSMSTEAICDKLRARGVQFDPASSKDELAWQLAEMQSQNGRSEASRRATSDSSWRPRSSGQQRAGAAAVNSAGRPGRTLRRPPSSLVNKSGFLELEDDVLTDTDEALMELESVVRSLGGAVWSAVQETASLFAGAASTLLPEAFSGDEPLSSAGEEARSRQERAAQQGGARMVRERASGLRRGVSAFVQSSANRAGVAVARSAANGVLRGAEGAADWAGGGAVAREYVLLFIAAFCLAFKRGIGSSVALLVIIRAGRISLQRLMEGGRQARGRRGATASDTRRPVVAEATRRGPTRPAGASRSGQAPPSSSRRSGRRPTSQRTSRQGATRGEPGLGKERRKRESRSSLDDLDSDGWGSDSGCNVM